MREWRILYEIDEDKNEVLVADIRHRGDAYRRRERDQTVAAPCCCNQGYE